MHFEAILKDRKTFGPFSRVLVIADDKVEAEMFARSVYKDQLIEVKEL